MYIEIHNRYFLHILWRVFYSVELFDRVPWFLLCWEKKNSSLHRFLWQKLQKFGFFRFVSNICKRFDGVLFQDQIKLSRNCLSWNITAHEQSSPIEACLPDGEVVEEPKHKVTAERLKGPRRFETRHHLSSNPPPALSIPLLPPSTHRSTLFCSLTRVTFPP